MVDIKKAVEKTIEKGWTRSDLEHKADATLKSIKRDMTRAKSTYPGQELANTKTAHYVINTCIQFIKALANHNGWSVEKLLKPYQKLAAQVNTKIVKLSK